MALGPRRGTYPAIASLMVMLAVIFGAARLVRQFIPERPPNVELEGHGAFLSLAARDAVTWLPARPAAFQKARQLGRPIFLLLGRASSYEAEYFDRKVFSDPDLAEALNRAWIPVRVDLDEEPYWESSLLPFSRLNGRPPQGFEIALLTPDGKLGAWFNRSAFGPAPDPVFTLDLISRERLKLFGPAELMAAQLSELKPLAASDFDPANSSPQNLSDRHIWMDQGRWEVTPWEMHALISQGRLEDAGSEAARLAQTPLIDWARGGVWLCADSADGRMVRFSRSPVVEADLTLALARLSAATQDDLARRMALLVSRKLVRDLSTQFPLPSGWLAKTSEDDRAIGISAPPARLAEIFSPVERAVAESVFHLRPEVNPVMMPYVDRPELALLADGVAAKTLRVLRSTGLTRWVRAATGTSSSRSQVASRLLESSVLLKDDALRTAGLAALEQAKLSRVGISDLVQMGAAQPEQIRNLSSYVSYAGACWMAWLATGERTWLLEGEAVLDRGRFLFRQEDGTWTASFDVPVVAPGVRAWPLSQTDGLARSDLAELAMTLGLYGSSLGRMEWLSEADGLRLRLNAVLVKAPSRIGGALDASLRLTRIRRAEGPDFAESYRQWTRRDPGALVSARVPFAGSSVK